MTSQYFFHEAAKNEEAILFDLYTRVMKEYITEIWGWDQKWQENDFSKHFNPENITVVREKGTMIGYSQVEDQGNQLYIRMLLVLPKYQRKSIGASLLSAVIEKARAESKSIALQVFKVNRQAKSFYEHCGFQVQGNTPSSFIMGLMPNQANPADAKKRRG
ncbi:MAG: GNAT family N-acetyltransferase [Gammaproteobacteria bacterium]|nr:GNAT family N-acetyltransferase [Gammaproteobacteria bacterium]